MVSQIDILYVNYRSCFIPVGLGYFTGSIFMFIKQLRIPAWGANIRFATATVIVFWTPVEILGRVNFLNEIWTARFSRDFTALVQW